MMPLLLYWHHILLFLFFTTNFLLYYSHKRYCNSVISGRFSMIMINLLNPSWSPAHFKWRFLQCHRVANDPSKLLPAVNHLSSTHGGIVQVAERRDDAPR
ncbi:hypothetical protein BJ742DRAFT_22417 [Cladochytrium replicatum]|nr:hypothetical protein BJ742DRAFT_22417 [Cladochytrium replicatum]